MPEGAHRSGSRPAPARRRLGWHHLMLSIPEHWEVVGYQNHAAEGSLVLADRHGQTMRVFWKAGLASPNLMSRLLAAAETEIGGSIAAQDLRSRVQERGGWLFLTLPEGRTRALACHFTEATGVLLYAVFPNHPDTRDAVSMTEILDSFQPNEGPRRVWAAFGIDATVPSEFLPERIRPLPAAQVIRFENSRGESLTVHRYGMLPALLEADDMATFFARHAGRSRRLFVRRHFLREGRYPGVELGYRTHGKGGMEGLLSPWWEGRVWIWRCDDIRRLYCVDYNAHRSRFIADVMEGVRSV